MNPNIRLSKNEQENILQTVHQYDPNAEIYIYGSRADTKKSGGDIDLLVISDCLNFSHKLDILVELKILLGEQKIDLSIKSQEDLKIDPFFLNITPKMERL